jgi:hypothetical protein
MTRKNPTVVAKARYMSMGESDLVVIFPKFARSAIASLL